MNTILKATTKGQITLPSKWRKKFKTDRFLVSFEGDVLKVKPLKLDDILGKSSNKDSKIIFNSARDNKGKGISAKDFLKAIKKIDG